jgi:uncharacterized membrane protein YkvI
MEEKSSVSIRKVVLLGGALCAYWIGSGFATGQEVLQFFAVNGIKGIFSALIFLIISGYFSYSLFGLGQTKKFENPYDVFEHYCGKYVGQAYIWYSLALVYGIFVVMLAGGGATLNQYYGVPTYLGTGTIALLALGTVLLGVEKLIDIIGVIGPVKIVFLVIIGICAIISLFGQPDAMTEADRLMPTLITCGASAKNVKEARTAAIAGVTAMTAAIVLLVIGELVYYKSIVGKQVPTLAMANNISPILGSIFSVLIVVSIYSACASFILMVVRKFAVDKTKKFNIIAVVLTAVGMFFGGVLPFDELVNILYPLAGYSAIVFAGFMIYKDLRARNGRFGHSEATRVDGADVERAGVGHP